MGIPAITYRATVNKHYDLGFYRLSNLLSHQCFDFDQLQQILSKILAGELGAADGDERQVLIEHHIAALDGPLACERIIDVLEKKMDGLSQLPKPPLRDRLEGWFKATKRRARQRSKSRGSGFHKLYKFRRHKYPRIPLQELRGRIRRFQRTQVRTSKSRCGKALRACLTFIQSSPVPAPWTSNFCTSSAALSSFSA